MLASKAMNQPASDVVGRDEPAALAASCLLTSATQWTPASATVIQP